MEEERVILSAGEQRRVMVLNHLEKGAVTVGESAWLLGISERQVKRLRAEYRQEGAAALMHGSRGRRPAAGERSGSGTGPAGARSGPDDLAGLQPPAPH